VRVVDELSFETQRIMELSDVVRQTAYEIHCYLKTGTWKGFMRTRWLIA
jgi:hypothetical protein